MRNIFLTEIYVVTNGCNGCSEGLLNVDDVKLVQLIKARLIETSI